MCTSRRSLTQQSSSWCGKRRLPRSRNSPESRATVQPTAAQGKQPRPFWPARRPTSCCWSSAGVERSASFVTCCSPWWSRLSSCLVPCTYRKSQTHPVTCVTVPRPVLLETVSSRAAPVSPAHCSNSCPSCSQSIFFIRLLSPYIN